VAVNGQTSGIGPPDGLRRGVSCSCFRLPCWLNCLQRRWSLIWRSHRPRPRGHGATARAAADAGPTAAIGGWRALLNLGGIANLTAAWPATGPERSVTCSLGLRPGNTLIDLAVIVSARASNALMPMAVLGAQGRVMKT